MLSVLGLAFAIMVSVRLPMAYIRPCDQLFLACLYLALPESCSQAPLLGLNTALNIALTNGGPVTIIWGVSWRSDREVIRM
jgi:hypothetical protein